jgi:putative SOS response-associated peptidase YedK
MCGRFTQPGDIDIIKGFRDRYGVEVNDEPGDSRPPVQRGQTATPFRDVNVIFTDREGITRIGAMYWQLIHHWNEEFKSKYTAFNTRVESLGKRHNEPLLRRRRCILPVRSFFETRKVGGVAVSPKESYEFTPKGGGLMALGGIYALWVNPHDEDDRRYSCSIITITPTEIIAEVHDRMPFVIPDDTVRAWLDPEVTDFDEIMDLIQPIDSTMLERAWEA